MSKRIYEKNWRKIMTDDQLTKIGEELIVLLNLKWKPNGRVNTTWGDKTPKGLALTVTRLIKGIDETPTPV